MTQQDSTPPFDDQNTATAFKTMRHELRNILSPAMLIAEGLAQNEDPRVRQQADRILSALDAAVGTLRRASRT